MLRKLPKITVWRAIFAAIMLSGLYATYLRIVYGLGGSTNLSDKFPWGIWIGFDVMCGVGLAAGGFTLVAMVHIFNIERYKPVLRPAILTAFLGYLLVVVGLLFDLGRPDRLWHPLVMWNPHSVMFEVAWCVTLYSTVLFLNRRRQNDHLAGMTRRQRKAPGRRIDLGHRAQLGAQPPHFNPEPRAVRFIDVPGSKGARE